ncbi:MAG: tyrosine-type recombinase/integrase [Lachnospiraceae bacterium]|nr:tyrosine-type recombinase/integrase [Lachnospiraceae bacterium]
MAKNDNSYHAQKDKEQIKKLDQLLDELPKFCKTFFRGIEQTTSSSTRLGYAYDLRIFFNFIREKNPLYKNKELYEIDLTLFDHLDTVDIEDYLHYLQMYYKDDTEYMNKEQGVKRKFSALRQLYNYLYCHNMIDDNPASKVSTPKLRAKEIIRLDPNEVADMLDQAESGVKLTKKQQQFHEKTKLRDVALLTLLLGTGIRVSECVGLDVNDVDFDNGCIKVIRKGGKEAIVYFGDEVEDALKEYMEHRLELFTPVEDDLNALFISSKHRRISVRAVELLVKKYSSLTTTLKHITPHKLRSTYGTQLYKETGDIYLVADVLGHRDVNTTKKHYAAIDDERRLKIRNAVQLREK